MGETVANGEINGEIFHKYHEKYSQKLRFRKVIKKVLPSMRIRLFCESERIRTFDRLLRREVLYPAELLTLLFRDCKYMNYFIYHKIFFVKKQCFFLSF